MFAWILLGVVVLVCLICAGISALRGLSKSVIRVSMVLFSAVAAVVTCLVLKGLLPPAEEAVILLENNLGLIGRFFGSNAVTTIEELLPFAEISPTLVELVVQLIGALLAPLLCLLLFFVYSLLTLLIYSIVTLIFRRSLKASDAQKSHPRLAAAGLGLAQGLVIAAILFLPLSAYLNLGTPVINTLVEENVLDGNDPVIQTVQSVVVEIDEAPTMTVYRVVGGKLMSSSLMKMDIADMDVKLEEEVESITLLAGHVLQLTKSQPAAYGEREAEILRAIGEAFDDSKLITPIAADVLFAASTAWMNDEAFLNMEKPDMGESNDLFEPFLDALLEVVNEDTEISQLLQGDVKTIAEMAAILSAHGVFAKIENPDELLTVLSGGDVVKPLVKELGNNRSMKRLIPEMTNLGVRAIGKTLNIPQNTDVVYASFTNEVATELNRLGSNPDAQQIKDFSVNLGTSFDEAGILVDGEVLEVYATGMIHDLVESNQSGEVTNKDVEAFFLLYAEQVTDDILGTETIQRPSYSYLSSKTPAVEIDDESKDPFAGTVYGGMTPDQRKNTAAAVLAVVCTELSHMDGESESFSEEAIAVVVSAFSVLLGEDHAAMENLKNVSITQPVSTSSIQNTAGMKSPESMKKVTVVITVEDLLVNSRDAANNITEETMDAEADAIAAIFNTAGSLVETLNNSNGEKMDINAVTASLGTILDSLKTTGSFGEEKTAVLFTAVLQSKTVRDTVGLDMKTATEMANKATEGGGNYTQTLNTVSGSLGILEKLQNNEKITDEELVEFMKNLTPQSAGMFQVFVTGDRLVTYGVPEQNSDVTAELVSSTFDYMSREDLEDYDKEAKALNVVLQMAMSARDSDDKKLFSSTDEAEDGKLPTAKTTVTRVLDSEALRYSFVDVLTDGKQVTRFDPFGVANKINHGSQDYIDCQTAIYEYRDAHPEIDDLVFEATAATFGVEIHLD